MKKAVFTIVKDETYFLKSWCNYYRQLFNADDIYILNNGEPLDGDNVPGISNIITKPGKYSFDVNFLLETVKDFQQKLLNNYNMVLFAEADEIIHAKNSFEKGLPGAVGCIGYEVIHLKDNEPAIDWQKPLLRQRKYWMKMPQFNKALWSSIPLRWSIGFHSCLEKPPISEDFTLIHLRRIDYNLCRQRWQKRKQWQRSDRHNPAHAVQWSDNISFNRWYDEQSDLIEIPESFKDVV